MVKLIREMPNRRRLVTIFALLLLVIAVRPSPVRAVTHDAKVTYPGSFALTGMMNVARVAHTATLLNDGTVLIAGGEDNNGVTQFNAELYNPSTGSFALTNGVMDVARIAHTATLLQDGTVLITGGEAATGTEVYDTADIYNPLTGLFTQTIGPMTSARAFHTATLLASGQVLISGGIDPTFRPVATAELYDPTTQTFALTATMTTERAGHTATLLQSGLVLLAGGEDKSLAVLKSAELYDPTAATFTATTKNMSDRKVFQTATLLGNGEVLVASGEGSTGATARGCRFYDPTTNKFPKAPGTKKSRLEGTATLLPSGDVLLTGGLDVPALFPAFSLSESEAYSISAGKFEKGAVMNFARDGHTATLLQNGTVLIAGGETVSGNTVTVQQTAEIFTP